MKAMKNFDMLILSILLTTSFLTVPPVEAGTFGKDGHFPTTSGSSWEYAISGLTLDSSQNQVMMAGFETASVTAGDGVFHSEIAFNNGNTTTADTRYNQYDALYIGSSKVVIKTSATSPFPQTSTSTSNESFSPPQEAFPAEVFAANVETSSGSYMQTITTSAVVMGFPVPPSTTTTGGTQTMRIEVLGNESVSVPAGTFPGALKLSKTVTVNETGQPQSTYTMTEWYAEGVGLVKFQSPNLNRDLVSALVKSVDVEVSGTVKSFSSLQEALDSAHNTDQLTIKGDTYFENLVYDRGVNCTLSGGRNSDFSTVTGYTKINGKLTVKSGGMAVSYLIIN